MSTSTKIVLTIAIICMVSLIAINRIVHRNVSHTSVTLTVMDGQISVQSFVKARLICPTTAEFSDWTHKRYNETSVVYCACVTSENVFGAHITKKFVAMVSMEDGEHIVLDNLVFLN